MSDKNTEITAIGLARMLQQFHGSVNLRALASSYLDQVQAFEDALWPLLGERALSAATGHRLDGIGQILNVPRAGRSDSDYRDALQAEIYVLTSTGTLDELLTIVQALVQMGTADYTATEYYPKGVVIRAEDYVFIDNSSASAAFVGTTLRRASPAATSSFLTFSDALDSGTFMCSTQASTVETDNVSPYTGLGSHHPGGPYNYEVETTVTGLASGDLRFNARPPSGATKMFIHNLDKDSTSQVIFLGALANRTLVTYTATGSVVCLCTAVTDQTFYWEVDIDIVRQSGTVFADDATVNIYSGSGAGILSGATPE